MKPAKPLSPANAETMRRAMMQRTIDQLLGTFDLTDDEAERENQRGRSERMRAAMRED